MSNFEIWSGSQNIITSSSFGEPSIKKVVLLHELDDSLTNMSSSSPSHDQHPTSQGKVTTLTKVLTNKIVELQNKWDEIHVPINLQNYMLH
jgi:hypothetical protein